MVDGVPQVRDRVILGLDNALRTSGVALVSQSSGKTLELTEIKTNAGDLIHKRLAYIYQQLQQLLKSDTPFDYVVFEDSQYQNNADTYKRLNMVQGVIYLFCAHKRIPYTLLSPSAWRKVIHDTYGVSFGRKRKEQKEAAIKFATEYSKTQDITSDQADALCIALAGRERLAGETSVF